MTEFAQHCQRLGKKIHRIEANAIADTSDIGTILRQEGVHQVLAVEPTDDWLKGRVSRGCQQAGVEVTWLEDPAFLTPLDVMQSWAEDRQQFRFTDFYLHQRKRLGVLLDANQKPIGGKWTFDTENRKKLPRNIVIPKCLPPAERESLTEAKQYVSKRFPKALGHVQAFLYPVTYQDAKEWLDRFLEQRLEAFGPYEDAISQQETFVFHSVLTPMLNIGLLTPQQVMDAVLSKVDRVPLNSLEGFLRQVIGWREFVRLIYLHRGSQQRTRNFWELTRPMPASFYDGTTGIVPVDHAIQRTLKYGYCHHIERLMVLGNFMLLCDIDPHAVYQWFMEMFIDSYDWVMVPNVYGMSQHADGGLMTTKPYISGSSYIHKMSDYPKGPWSEIWDALYWRFVDRERSFFSQNPRMRVMVSQLDRMGTKRDHHLAIANRFLNTLHHSPVA